MCDCKKNIEERLLERFKELSPEATDHKVSLNGYALLFGRQLRAIGYMHFEQSAVFPLKKGGTKPKTEKLNMQFTFCPWCAQPYDGGTPELSADANEVLP